jgi:broad specificity phosphatase PhoE
LVLVRHGESELNAANQAARIYCGQIETPLTPRGRQQAVDAARRLAELDYLRLARAVSSPLGRAAETLEIVLASLAQRIERLPAAAGLMERSHGLFEGRREQDVFREHPRYRDDPHYNGFMNHFDQHAPGGESLAQVTERAWPALLALAASGTGDLLVVSHYNAIRCILGKALDLPAAAVLQMRVPNAVPIVLAWDRTCRLIEGAEVLQGD